MEARKHVGELPLDIVDQCVEHGDKAVAAISNLSDKITKNKDEFERLVNDMECYKEFAYSFKYKVLGAQQVLNYKWSKNVEYLKRPFRCSKRVTNTTRNWPREQRTHISTPTACRPHSAVYL